MKAVRSKCCKI